MSEFKSALENETGLGHRTLGSVNKKDNAINHFKNALHLAAEVGVSGGVDNVDFCAIIINSGVFCEYRYSSFALKVAGVHNPVFNDLVVAENSALFEHLVYECCFAVVNVGNNCHVS